MVRDSPYSARRTGYQNDFKNPQGETARHGLGEPVRSPIEGKIIRIDKADNGLIIADKDGNVIGVRHMKLANNPRDKDGNPLKPEDAHKQRVWKTGDTVKVGDTLGYIDNVGAGTGSTRQGQDEYSPSRRGGKKKQGKLERVCQGRSVRRQRL